MNTNGPEDAARVCLVFLLTAEDVRFTTKGDALYVIDMGVPRDPLKIKSLGSDARLFAKSIGNIQLLGSDEAIQWSQDDNALTITPPTTIPCPEALVFKIMPKM